jgi:uncharacterized membrane protein YfcA
MGASLNSALPHCNKIRHQPKAARTLVASLIIACLAGIYFGLYYNVLVLAPLTLVVVLTSGAVSIWHGQPYSAALLALIIPAVGLQGGYMIGLTGRDLLGQLITRRRTAPSKGF